MWDGNFNCQVQGPPRPHRPAMTIIRNDEDDVALDIPMIVSFKGPVLSCLVPCGASLGTGTPRMIWQCQSLQGPMNLTH